MFQITSNLLYLCASIVAAIEKRWAWAVIMAAVTCCSVLYHMNILPRKFDIAVALTAFAYGCVLFMQKGHRPWSVPIFTLAMIACLAVHKPDLASYDAIHPWAHVFGGLASISLASS